MNRLRSIGRLIRVAGALTVSLLLGVAQAQPTAAEQARIDHLLNTLAQDTQHQFERNGTRYTGAEATRFLRAKWQAKGGSLRTAEEFVEQIGSRSTTTGQPYRVCTGPQACVPARDHLMLMLKAP